MNCARPDKEAKPHSPALGNESCKQAAQAPVTASGMSWFMVQLAAPDGCRKAQTPAAVRGPAQRCPGNARGSWDLPPTPHGLPCSMYFMSTAAQAGSSRCSLLSSSGGRVSKDVLHPQARC